MTICKAVFVIAISAILAGCGSSSDGYEMADEPIAENTHHELSDFVFPRTKTTPQDELFFCKYDLEVYKQELAICESNE